MSVVLFYVTHPDENQARRLGQKMIEQRLAACANYFPVQNCYWWQGSMHTDHEWVSLLKTAPELSEKLARAIRAAHPYEVPCILHWEVHANEAYEHWIRAETLLSATQ